MGLKWKKPLIFVKLWIFTNQHYSSLYLIKGMINTHKEYKFIVPMDKKNSELILDNCKGKSNY